MTDRMKNGECCTYNGMNGLHSPWCKKTDRAAAPASERPLPLLPEPGFVYMGPTGLPEHGYSADQMNEYVLADRAASAPQAVRMLSEDEAKSCMDWTLLPSEVEAVQRKFCEVNGLAIVPLAPQDTGGK